MAVTYELIRDQWVEKPLHEVFEFFSDAHNLEQITPPWLRFEVLTPRPIEMKPGAHIDYRLKWRGLPLRWRTQITQWEPPMMFEDVQLQGPYSLWRHAHWFESYNGGTKLIDHVEYGLPFGALGRFAHAIAVKRNVRQIFDYRQDKVRQLFGGPEAK